MRGTREDDASGRMEYIGAVSIGVGLINIAKDDVSATNVVSADGGRTKSGHIVCATQEMPKRSLGT